MERKLYRSRSDRMIAGVCGGIAEYFEIDPTFVRLLAALAAIVSFGAIAIAYVIMAIVVPESPEVASVTPPVGATAPTPTPPPMPPAPAPQPMPMPVEYASSPASAPADYPPPAAPEQVSSDVAATPQRRTKGAGLVAGIIVLCLGIALLASQFVPGFDVWRLWPLIIVAIGLGIIFRGGRR